MLGTAQNNLYLSRRALVGGPPPLSLTLDLSDDVEWLVEECGCGEMSELEAAFRREVSTALDIPVSSVMIDCLRTPSAGCTEVKLIQFSIRKSQNETILSFIYLRSRYLFIEIM